VIFCPYVTGKAVTAIANGDAILQVVLLLAGLFLTNALIRFLQQFFMASIGQRVINHIRTELFDHVRVLPLSYTDHKQHGELMSRLTNDVDSISTTISNSLTLLLSHFFTILGIFVMMLVLSPVLTAVSLAGVGLIFLLTKAVTKRTRKLFKARQQALGSLNGQVEESISGLSVVKSFGREAQMEADFIEKNDLLCQTSIRALICSGYLMPLMNVINNLCYLFLAVLSGILYIEGKIGDIGLITSFLLYVRQFTRPFVEIANIYNNFQTAVAGADGFIERLPKGYDTVLEQGGNELSQGERQLLTIARAVLGEAPIIVLDEATSSVDTVTERKIRKAMLEICEGRTSFIIAHRLSTIRESDLILLIEDGVIKERGTHEELIRLNGKYAEMFRVQSGQISEEKRI